jgi:hypothetical protein
LVSKRSEPVSNLFPKWVNAIPTVGAVCLFGGLVFIVWGTWYWATPDFFKVGYMPTQPAAGFDHQLHAGKLGIDCRYCHTKVEVSAEANIPHVSTCMGCHEPGRLGFDVESRIATRVAFIQEAYENDEPIPWRRVHKLPDYVRNFPHHIHVAANISCFSCHGQITAMPQVFQAEGLGMGWCLDCHRDLDAENHPRRLRPERHLVPHGQVTQLKWVEEEWFANADGNREIAMQVLESLRIRPPENCGACHY